MQVVHQQDMDTHALVGGSDIQAFGITQDASFFEVLSNTLYSNKPMAVIREVLCNAWDSHKASGRTDVAVVVTIDDDELKIRDYGEGIPHDKIHGIYCVYGNSTKKNDGNQTGGFGLGSKSPFAYTEHFTVENSYNGMRHVNAISRGSAKTNGVPDFRTMVKVPTTESGVEVAIPIKSWQDVGVFKELVETIAKYGEMNVILNGLKIDTIKLSSSKEGFLINKHAYHGTNERIFVRYGNVVYPVVSNDDYADEYDKVLVFLKTLRGPGHNYYDRPEWRILFDAPPNSISVTPSRESLSTTDTTTETLKTLFNSVTVDRTADYQAILKERLQAAINQYWNLGDQYRLLDPSEKILNKFTKSQYNEMYTYRECVSMIIHSNHTCNISEMAMRLQSFVDRKDINRHKIKQAINLLNLIDKGSMWQHTKSIKEHVKRNILAPLINKTLKSTKVDIKNLFIMEKETHYGSRRNWKYTPLNKFEGDIDAMYDLLNNAIWVLSSRISFEENVGHMFSSKTKYGSSLKHRLVYIAPRTKNARKDAVEFFQSINLAVIDHISYHEELNRPAAGKVNAVPVPKVPKVIGIPALSMLTATGKRNEFNPRGHFVENPTRIEKPEFVFKPDSLSGSSYNHKFFAFSDHCGPAIVSLYGHLGGIVVNQPQLDKYIKEGAEDGYVWLGKRLLEEFQTNPNLVRYVSMRFANLDYKSDPDYTESLIGTVRRFCSLNPHTDTFKKELNLPELLTLEEQKIIKIWESVAPNATWSHTRNGNVPKDMKPFVTDIQKLIDAVGIDPQLKLVVDLLKSKPLLKLLDFEEIFEILSSKTHDDTYKSEAETLLLLTLQG